MKNKFRIGELVIIDGIGYDSQKKYKAFGLILEKDYSFNQYYVLILSNSKKEWIKEKDLRIVLDRKNKRKETYKVILATNIKGIIYIKKKIKSKENQNNNLLNKVDIYHEFNAYKKRYAILIWTSVHWPESNFVVQAIESSLDEFRKLNIGYKFLKVSEFNPKDIVIREFTKNDVSLDNFEIIQLIKVKNMGGILIW